jgi:bifunctional non-homologous end joining protein LigD
VGCEHRLEGIVSKRVDGRYEPDRRTWLKTKCLNREEFVVVGWSDPEGR